MEILSVILLILFSAFIIAVPFTGIVFFVFITRKINKQRRELDERQFTFNRFNRF
jgi:uncharacterized protein YoxC